MEQTLFYSNHYSMMMMNIRWKHCDIVIIIKLLLNYWWYWHYYSDIDRIIPIRIIDWQAWVTVPSLPTQPMMVMSELVIEVTTIDEPWVTWWWQSNWASGSDNQPNRQWRPDWWNHCWQVSDGDDWWQGYSSLDNFAWKWREACVWWRACLRDDVMMMMPSAAGRHNYRLETVMMPCRVSRPFDHLIDSVWPLFLFDDDLEWHWWWWWPLFGNKQTIMDDKL